MGTFCKTSENCRSLTNGRSDHRDKGEGTAITSRLQVGWVETKVAAGATATITI
jgi:hypothetical protein